MVKNMKNEKTNENRDDIAAIGIGAMIVFIALILVAAVAAAVIIQTAEKLQQNAQKTGDDTQKSMSNKINIIGGVRGATNTVVLTLELAAGSSNVAGVDVKWTAICAAGVDDGDMNAAANINTVGSNPAAFAPNEMYSYTMALPTCSTDADVTLLIDSAGAGFTYERFDATVAQGLAVI
jgi:flagellin FlaB